MKIDIFPTIIPQLESQEIVIECHPNIEVSLDNSVRGRKLDRIDQVEH